MSKGRIFLVGDGQGKVTALEETGYVTEEVLQKFLAQYPDLLPGDQIDPETPCRWLLVTREMDVTDGTSQSGRWSVDHLFLDQEGIPTFVECKRATDTRIRREVMGQMLDYAANGTEYWTLQSIRQAMLERIRRAATMTRQESLSIQEGQAALNGEVLTLLGEGADGEAVDAFWSNVEANLRNRKVRLIFVADALPRELRRLVEFLNEEMTNVEVYAVEVKQYQGSEPLPSRALVPRLVGATEAARATKRPGAGSRPHTTREEFLERCTPESKAFFQQVLDSAQAEGHTIYWGEKGFSVRAPLTENGEFCSFAYGYPPHTFQLFFYKDGALPGDKSSPLRQALLRFHVFKESGEYTLWTHVGDQHPSQIGLAWKFMLEQVAICLKSLKKARARDSGS